MNRRMVIAVALLLCVQTATAKKHHGPQPDAPIRVEAPAETVPPAMWIDVREPARARDALRRNAWLSRALARPLGEGFLGSWRAFLGTRGEDIRAAFKGAVADAALAPLLSQPFRIAWYSARGSTQSPALIVPAPGSAALLAHAALGEAARRGTAQSRCPRGAGDERIDRWVLAEHAVYAARGPDRIVLSRHPTALMQALCGPPPQLGAGGEVEIGFAPELIGRGAQMAAALAGLGDSVRLQLRVGRDGFAPAGLAGALAKPARLSAAPLSADLLRLAPASTPVVLAANLGLPSSLDAASLKAFWGGASTPVLPRQAAVLFWPRGDWRRPHEIAVAWSRPADDAALAAIFNGRNKLSAAMLCNHLVFASTAQVLERVRRSCDGHDPGLSHLARSVVEGLQAPGSLGLFLQPGRALPQIASDGYWGEIEAPTSDAPRAAPPEIEEALRELSSLPSLGFFGIAKEAALVPRGFGS